MKKNYLATLALVFCASLCLAQTQKQDSKTTVSENQNKLVPNTEPSATVNISTAKKDQQKRTKVAPEVFYVVDDKPVDYKTYLLHLQKAKSKN